MQACLEVAGPAGLAPRVLGVCPGGRVEAFITGRTWTVGDMRDRDRFLKLVNAHLLLFLI